MTTLTDLPEDIHVHIMTLLESPATLEAYLSTCPLCTQIFLAYFRRIVQTVLEKSFSIERLRRYFYAILIAHFDNPSHRNTVIPFLTYFFDRSSSAKLGLPACVPHTMESLEYISSVRLALDYFYPCAEDITLLMRTSRRKVIGGDIDPPINWDAVSYQSQRILLRVQLEAELFHHIVGLWYNIPGCRYYWERYSQEDMDYCKLFMSVLAHWMRQKMGLDTKPRYPETNRYARAVDIEPPNRLNSTGLPQLHQVAEDGPYAEFCKRYALRFASQKMSRLLETRICIQPRSKSESSAIGSWDSEESYRASVDHRAMLANTDYYQSFHPPPIYVMLPDTPSVTFGLDSPPS